MISLALAFVLAQTSSPEPTYGPALQYGVLGLIFLAFMAFVRHQIWVVIPNKEKAAEAREKAAADERAAFLSFNLKTQEAFEERLTQATSASALALEKVAALFEKHVDSCEERCDQRHAEIVATQQKLHDSIQKLLPTNGYDRGTKA